MFLFAEAETNALFAIFENNVINWLLLVGFLCWVGAKVLPGVLKNREDAISNTLASALSAREESLKLLARQKEAVANAEKEAAEILSEAKQAASEMKANMEAQTQKDMDEMLTKFQAAVEGERQMLVNEMRHATVKAAVKLAEAQLRTQTTSEVKAQLLNQFMEQLGTLNPRSNALPSQQHFESVSK
jgi:F-type H+-transporting ATPase subunit b